MAWPLAVGMLSYTLMMLVDTFLMGHVSTTAQAGVAVAAVTVAALRAVFRGVASGAQAIVAAAHGARDDARVLAAASAAAWLGAGYGLVGAAIIAGVAVSLAPALLADAPVADAASIYMAIVGVGLPFSMASIGLMAGIQGVGETRVHMVVSVAANVVNAVLGAALVFG
jgi:Na+-driven multidrug efflux pump